MSISKLHIFSKNRDATAAMKGYQYQHLTTLETWLMNRVNNVDEVIYCDFEEDIFTRNIEKRQSKFHQIKLYSSNFSFSTEATQDTIANFFMLYTKGDYVLDDVIFSFETNASVAKKVVKGNDADVLKEWADAQGALPKDLLDKLRIKVKGILDDYIEKEYKAKTANGQPAPEFEAAFKMFKEMPEEALDKFIQSIRWTFEGIDPNTAILQKMDSIKKLIEKLPLRLHESTDVNLSILYHEVVRRSIQDNPEDRVLSNTSLDLLLLNAGDEKSRWYAEVYARWESLDKITYFNAGEFYEVVNAARHYRVSYIDAAHSKVWEKFLLDYSNLTDIEPSYKRKAIYELTFILLDDVIRTGWPSEALEGHEDAIRFYFDKLDQRKNLQDVHEDITLLQILLAASKNKLINIEEGEVNEWKNELLAFLDAELKAAENTDTKCKLLELRGSFEFHTALEKSPATIEKAIAWYRQILPQLPNTKLYSVSPLFDELESIQDMLIQVDGDAKTVDTIENFLPELQDAAINSGNRHIVAKRHVNKGVQLLHAGGQHDFLNALNHFHKAKDLWYQEHTKEGYILALLNLSQVYYALGMNIAGKYYAMCAIWSIWHFEDESLYHRLAQGTGLVFAGDFMQGAWMNAIDDFQLFILTKNEFESRGLPGRNEFFQKVLPDLAFIIHASPILAPELTHYIEFVKSQMGDLWTNRINPIVEELKKAAPDEASVIRAARAKITSEALSDLGKRRTIAFDALNIEWHISFENTHQDTAIAEEFTSALQVILCEIARVNKDVLKKDQIVNINITISEKYQPEELNENTGEWNVYIPRFDSKEQEKITFHYAFLGSITKSLLSSLSRLGSKEFDEFFNQTLHEKEKIAQRILCMNTYQKFFKNTIGDVEFEKSKRNGFNSLPPHLIFPKLHKLLNDQK
jgi:hypothetical protein